MKVFKIFLVAGYLSIAAVSWFFYQQDLEIESQGDTPAVHVTAHGF